MRGGGLFFYKAHPKKIFEGGKFVGGLFNKPFLLFLKGGWGEPLFLLLKQGKIKKPPPARIGLDRGKGWGLGVLGAFFFFFQGGGLNFLSTHLKKKKFFRKFFFLALGIRGIFCF